MLAPKQTIGLPTILAFYTFACIPFFWNCAIDKYFSADAAFYFVRMLDAGNFMDFAWSRNHAVYLTEWPLILAVDSGVTNLAPLQWLHGFGIFFPTLISIVLSIAFCPKPMRSLLLLHAMSFFALTYPADNIMTGESHVLVFLTWPILFAILSDKLQDNRYFAALMFVLLAYTRLYESALFTAPLLMLILLYRLYKKELQLPAFKKITILGFLFAAAVIAVWAVVFPRDPNNRTDFVGAMASGLIHPQFLASFIFLIFWYWSTTSKRNGISILGLLISTVLVGFFIFSETTVSASISFACRTLSFTTLPLLLIAAWRLSQQKTISYHQAATGLFLALMIGFHFWLSRSWMDYRNDFKTALNENSGFVAVETTGLNQHPQKWYWTNPILSYLWSETDVKTIILNEPGNYEPYKAQEEPIIARYKTQRLIAAPALN
jgi:hypothetical protein